MRRMFSCLSHLRLEHQLLLLSGSKRDVVVGMRENISFTRNCLITIFQSLFHKLCLKIVHYYVGPKRFDET